MPFDAKTLKQPWVKYSLIAIGVLGAGYILYSRVSGSNAPVSAGGVDPALAQLQAQQNQLDAQSSMQASAQASAIQLSAQHDASTLENNKLASSTAITEQAAQIGGQLSLAQLQTAEQTQLAQINHDNIAASLETQATMQKNNLDAMVALANVTANTQMHISDNQAGVANTQSNNATQVQKKSADNAMVPAVMKGIGAIASMFF